MKKAIWVVGLALALVAGSCDSKEEDKLTLNVPGADSTTAVNALTQEQATALCNNLAEYFKDLLSGDEVCNFAGAMMNMMGGQSGMTCQQVVDACKKGSSQMTGMMDAYSPTTMCTEVIGTEASRIECTVTVAELQACWQEMKSLMSDVFGSTNCSTTQNDLMAKMQNMNLDKMQNCVVVGQKCAALQPSGG